MNQSLFFKLNLYIILSCFATTLLAVVHRPSGDEIKINLEIKNKERIYYELNEGLLYENIGKQYNVGDSIKIGLHSRTIKAPTGKKKRNYGYSIQINNETPFELKFKKEGSKVISPERPGWNYTKSGVWYIYIPIEKEGINIKILPLKGNPVVYIRLTSNLMKKKGSYGNIIQTVNRQNKVNIVTDDKKRKYYKLDSNNQQQFEIKGPTQIRVFSRLLFDNQSLNDEYFLYIKEDGIDLGNFYFNTEKSTESYIPEFEGRVGKWRSIWINIPEGKHYYTFKLSNLKDNQNKTIFIRLKEWINE